MKEICIKLGYKIHCIFKYIVKKLYFLFVKHIEQILEMLHYKNKHQKLLALRKIYLKSTFPMWKLKINSH